MAKQAAARIVLHRDTPEVAAIDARHTVVASQPLVQKGVVGAQQVEDAAILADDALEEQLRLAAHRATQVVVEVREEIAVRLHAADVAQLQPLAGEVGDQRTGLGIRQHPADLRIERGLQPATFGAGQQRLVGNAAPEEER